MGLLYYWRHYAKDMRETGKDFNLIQNSPRMHELEPGESLWAFCRRQDGEYVPAAELVVVEVTEHDPPHEYGRYQANGDPARSRYFDPELSPSIEPLVRSLSIDATAAVLGHSFQGAAGVRVLSPEDEARVREFCAALAVLR